MHNGHDESQGRRVDEVDELCVQEGLQTMTGLLRRILESLQQGRNDGLDLGVPDDRPDDLQGLGSGSLDLVVGVAEDLDQLGDDGGQARRQLRQRATVEALEIATRFHEIPNKRLNK